MARVSTPLQENYALDGFELVLTEKVNDIFCEFYRGMGFEGAITRDRLGEILGYSKPGVAIGKIHARHKERLDARSGYTSLVYPDGGTQKTVVYSIEGALEVCRWSRSPAADVVMDTLYAVFKKLLLEGSVKKEDLPELIAESVVANQKFAYETIIPALHMGDINQRHFLTEYLGLKQGNTTSEAKISHQLETNFKGKEMMKVWKRKGIRFFTLNDLPLNLRAKVEEQTYKWSHSSKYFGVFLNLYGVAYFDSSGLRMILEYAVKRSFITEGYARKWFEDETGGEY